jgi:dihydrofolate reductase
MEAPGGDDDFVRGAWTFKFHDPEGTKFKLDEIQTHDAHLLGRKTYEGFAVQTLLEHDLADEYRLMVFPIVLGTGKRLFGETPDASVLKLVDSKVLDSGTVILTYHPARG